MKETASKNNISQLVRASARQLRVAPRKLRLVANMVKKMHVSHALAQLRHSPKKAAPFVARLIQSAVANAKNNFKLDPEKLYIKSITADMGQAMKRYFPRARGSAFVIKRKLSHLNVVLEEKSGSKPVSSKLAFLKKASEKQKSHTESIEHEEAVSKKEVKEPKHQKVIKTDEQIKMNKVQNKRRLFNRKSGE